jgi:uncharacterized membrane protein YedE/YeeE
MANVVAALAGLIFGLGLIVSMMAQPAKVLNFLDLFGQWDPSLLLVMAAALAVSAAGYAFANRLPAPFAAPQWSWPTNNIVDRPLIFGAILFGLGWGLVGLCPGPALVNLATLHPKVIAFVAAMALGMIVHDVWRSFPRPAPAIDG